MCGIWLPYRLLGCFAQYNLSAAPSHHIGTFGDLSSVTLARGGHHSAIEIKSPTSWILKCLKMN